MRTKPISLTPLLLILVASCSTSAPEPTAATLPDRPAGWRSIASDAGDVALLVPPDFEASFTAEGVLAQPADQDGASTLEIWAHGPVSVPQPTAGETLRDWLEQSGWVPVAGGVTTIGDRTDREVLLASGRALQVALTVQPRTPEESRVVVYAVQTQTGIAILRFIGWPPQRIHERADELEIVAQLATFGEPAAGD